MLEFDHVHIISSDPHASARWYVTMLGATVEADTIAYEAPQIFLSLGGKTVVIRGRRPGEQPAEGRPILPRGGYSSHDTWGIDHFGFLYRGDLTAFRDELRTKGATFPVELKRGVDGSLLCYVAAPDGVTIELMETR